MDEEDEQPSWRALFFRVPEETNAIAVCFRAALLAGLGWYGWRLAAMDIRNGEIGGSLMHYDPHHPYQPQLMLLTGTTGDHGAHDFIDVLGDLGLLMKAQPIGRGVHAFGVGMLLLAIAWGGYVLLLQYRNRSRLD